MGKLWNRCCRGMTGWRPFPLPVRRGPALEDPSWHRGFQGDVPAFVDSEGRGGHRAGLHPAVPRGRPSSHPSRSSAHLLVHCTPVEHPSVPSALPVAGGSLPSLFVRNEMEKPEQSCEVGCGGAAVTTVANGEQPPAPLAHSSGGAALLGLPARTCPTISGRLCVSKGSDSTVCSPALH